jgi:hypothetical protein
MRKKFIVKLSFFHKQDESKVIRALDNIEALKIALDSVRMEDKENIIGIRFSYISSGDED